MRTFSESLQTPFGRRQLASSLMQQAEKSDLPPREVRRLRRHGGRISELIVEYYAEYPEAVALDDRGAEICRQKVAGSLGLIGGWLLSWLVSYLIRMFIDRLLLEKGDPDARAGG